MTQNNFFSTTGQLRGGKWHGEATYTTQVQILSIFTMCSWFNLSFQGFGNWRPKQNTKFQRNFSQGLRFPISVLITLSLSGGGGEEGDVGQWTESLISIQIRPDCSPDEIDLRLLKDTSCGN